MRRPLSGVDADRLDLTLGAQMFTRTGRISGRRITAIDGKTVCGARDHTDPRSTAPHLVAALCHTTGIGPGQCQIDSKFNEIPALRDLLDVFDLDGVLVSADALHCQRDTAAHIVGVGGHHLLCAKSHRMTLLNWVKSFHWARLPTNTGTELGHGRRVARSDKALQLGPGDTDSPGARQVI